MFPSLRPLVVEKLCQMGKLCIDTWKSKEKETSVVLARVRIQMQDCKIVSSILGIAEKMTGVWLTTLHHVTPCRDATSRAAIHLDLVVTQGNTYSLSVYSKHWPWSGENSSSWPRFKFKTRSRSLKRGEPNTVILLERATQLLSNRIGSLHVSNDDAPLSSPTQLSLAFLVLISLTVDYPQHNLFKIYILSYVFSMDF